MPKLSSFFSDLRKHLDKAKLGELKLGKEEKVERKYIKELKRGRKSISGAREGVKLFLNEVEYAETTLEHLMAAEEDEFNIQKLSNNNRTKLNQRILDEFQGDVVEIDRLVRKFAKEIQELNVEARSLEEILSEFENPELEQELHSGFQRLKEIDKKTQNLVENEDKLKRRDFTKIIGGAAVGSGLASYGKAKDQDLAKIILQQEKQKCKEMPSNTSLTRREASKPDRNVRQTPGKVEEKLVKDGLEFELESIRTSSKSAVTILNIKNKTNQATEIDVKLSIKNWSSSGAHNYTSGGPNAFRRTVKMPPKSNFALGADLVKVSDSPGSLNYRISGANIKEEIRLNMPRSIVEDHAISSAGQIGGTVELHYQAYRNGSEYGADLQLLNSGSETKLAHLIFSIPSGWSFNSRRGSGSVGGGVLSADFELTDSETVSVGLNKTSSEASNIAVANLIFCPPDKFEQLEYYLIPVNLDK